MPGRAGCEHGTAGTRLAPRRGTPCSGAARPPTPNLPHQTVTSSPGPEPAQPGREGNVPEIDATWHPEAVSRGLGGDGNQLLRAVSRKILFMIDDAATKLLSWLLSPSPSTHGFCYCPPFSVLFLFPPLAVLSSAALGPRRAGGAGRRIPRHIVSPQLRTADLCTAGAGGLDLLPGPTDRYLMQSLFLPVIKRKFIRTASVQTIASKNDISRLLVPSASHAPAPTLPGQTLRQVLVL